MGHLKLARLFLSFLKPHISPQLTSVVFWLPIFTQASNTALKTGEKHIIHSKMVFSFTLFDPLSWEWSLFSYMSVHNTSVPNIQNVPKTKQISSKNIICYWWDLLGLAAWITDDACLFFATSSCRSTSKIAIKWLENMDCPIFARNLLRQLWNFNRFSRIFK